MGREELLKLLELEMKEEQHFILILQKDVAFFWSIISAIILGTTVGLFKAIYWFHYLFLIAGTVTLLATSHFMKKTLFRDYQRFLECIVVRAKIEQLLGFHNLYPKDNAKYWQNESLLIQRHLESREKFCTSKEFIEYNSTKGIYNIYSKLLTTIQIISIILTIGLIALAIVKFQP